VVDPRVVTAYPRVSVTCTTPTITPPQELRGLRLALNRIRSVGPVKLQEH